MSRSDWHLRANCAGVDVAVFFLKRGESTAEARALCEGCEVQAECLSAAIYGEKEFGLFGAKSPNQRAVMRSADRARQATA